jgi:hypothetical protein
VVRVVATTKGTVNTVTWPSGDSAEKRFEALRVRDHELVESARTASTPARIAELEEENQYFRVVTKFRSVGKPGWLWVKLSGLAIKVIRRLLKRA